MFLSHYNKNHCYYRLQSHRPATRGHVIGLSDAIFHYSSCFSFLWDTHLRLSLSPDYIEKMWNRLRGLRYCLSAPVLCQALLKPWLWLWLTAHLCESLKGPWEESICTDTLHLQHQTGKTKKLTVSNKSWKLRGREGHFHFKCTWWRSGAGE